jgi:hypothetical protein
MSIYKIRGYKMKHRIDLYEHAIYQFNENQYRELLQVIYGMWEQFSYQGGKDGNALQWSGGLSDLERCEDWLKSQGYINDNGYPTKELKKILYHNNKENK